MKITKGQAAVAIIIVTILLDQLIKIWVKTHFYLGEELKIAEWFRLVFVENDGMAFGMQMGSKLFLTLFRIVAVAALGWIIVRFSRRQDIGYGFIACLALVTAGAAGNIIDCVLYGVIFNNPMPPAVAVMFPDGGGYAPLLYGKVVDMFYFPLFSFDWPDWVPWVGGENFLFFQPVFNLADAAISVGMVIIILFYTKHLSGKHSEEESADTGIRE